MKKEMEDLEKNSGDFVSKEEIKVLIEALSKPQLVDLLSQLGSKYPSIAQEIESFENVDRTQQKLNALQVHGEIEEGDVMLDRDTGKSAQSALNAPSSFIDGVSKLSDDEGLTKTTSSATDLSQRNLYIGNLSRRVTGERLLYYFKGHGDIEECVLVHQYNKDLNISSRSGFVTYKTAEAAKNAIKDLDQSTLEGRTITVKYDLHNVEGCQPSVPARVALNANALNANAPNAAPPYPYLQTDAPPFPYPQTGAPYAAPPYPYPQTDASHAAPPPYPYAQTGARYAAFPYPYLRTTALYAASPYPTLLTGVFQLADQGLTKTISSATDLSKRILYIENLSRQVTREILLNYFERHGDIEECVLAYQRHDDSTVSRSAFVTYKTVEAAKNAIKDLDQSTLEGKTITVKYVDFPNGGGRQPSCSCKRVSHTSKPMHHMLHLLIHTRELLHHLIHTPKQVHHMLSLLIHTSELLHLLIHTPELLHRTIQQNMDNEVVNFEVVVETILRHGVREMEKRFIEYAKYSFEQQHEIQISLVSSGCLICII
ncbi:RNA-binding (RRM/RBD/RNP motifs) family protein [Trifolium repens]|nr:RNA-binding (RRM/RBD/RNP motifs) family protein [Trifolium repens]